MSTFNQSVLIAYASGLGAQKHECALGPEVILAAPEMEELKTSFAKTVEIKPDNGVEKLAAIPKIASISQQVADLTARTDFFVTLGGDHTSAIGTYSGPASNQSFGLIWVDAHLDSHTPTTSHTKNPHGMPLATLLGHGDPRLTQISSSAPKIRPQHLCVIGARSYEPEEQELLEELGVRIYYIEEIQQRGLTEVFNEACLHVQDGTDRFGISIDVDALDPNDAPGTGVQEPNGIRAQDLINALQTIPNPDKLAGVDITEFNPALDIDRRTELVIIELLKTILACKSS